MEDLAPPLKFVAAVRAGIEHGESIRTTVIEYTKREHDEFAQQVVVWMGQRDQGRQIKLNELFPGNVYRQGVLFTIERGLAGESIYPHLQQLEEELIEICRREMDQYVSLLAFRLLLPLLLFQFPAFLILLFGPLLQQVLQSQ